MAILGFGNATPVFSMVPTFGLFKPAGLLPTITEEDRVILNNVQTILEFLTAGSSLSRTSNQVLTSFMLRLVILKFLKACGVWCSFKILIFFICCVYAVLWGTSTGFKCVSGYPRASSSFSQHLFQSAPWSAQSIIFTGISTCDSRYNLVTNFLYLPSWTPQSCIYWEVSYTSQMSNLTLS